MKITTRPRAAALFAFVFVVAGTATLLGQETFQALVQRLQKEKPQFAVRHEKLLAERYEKFRKVGEFTGEG